ncbi:hypothetical protein [Devosia sp. RR2S18]|uniref:hypothetical protein n=1 Tax=Devosia rhizosphaerae TaxID=3049774 RepID=UPI00253FE207|nr:hypothetical protein [Devosia sp. RR2S18]WIJ26947.1 hypothetical protein QOV41_09455 [Devosia sp. RR2S18]
MAEHVAYDPKRRGQWRLAVWVAAAGIYLIPVVLKVTTSSLNWDMTDFLFAAVLIFTPVLIYDATTRRVASRSYRAGMGLALFASGLLIYVNASVGIIGSSSNPANLLYLVVIAVGFTGGFAARLSPDGMCRTMLAVAAGQALITLVAVLRQLGYPASGPLELTAINGVFVAMWLLAALLFSRASREWSRFAPQPGGTDHA